MTEAILDSAFNFVFDVISIVIALIPVAIFLSGALAVTLSYLFGRKLLRRLLRLATRTHTFYLVVHSDFADDAGAWLDAAMRANGALVRSLETVPPWGKGPAIIKARVRINRRFRTKAVIARLGQGMAGIAGVQDFYVEV